MTAAGSQSHPGQPVGSDQIVFIDSRVSDKKRLLRGLAPGTQVYVLNADQDGLAQIAAVLASHKNVAAVSIIAHGNDGEMELGRGFVTEATLARSAADLKTIGAALAPGGDLLLYGCDVGAGTAGHSFVNAAAAATGATVAAASHIVGDVAAGEGWNLDVVSNAKPIAAPQVLGQAALNSYNSPLAAAATLPITITSFTGNTSFTTSGSTTITSGTLQLTSAATSQAGLAVYNSYIASTTGLSVQFNYYSGGGNGADGISFFLLNADLINAGGGSASTVVAGGFGGGLGYSDDGRAGITDGFLGIGFDTYGNYTTTDGGQPGSGSAVPNDVGIRGSGSGTTGYNVLTNSVYSAGIDGTRTVKINLANIDSTHESVTVSIAPVTNGTTGTFQTVISSYVVNQALPSNVYFGFGASTGGSTDTHQIQNLSVATAACFVAGTHVLTDRGEVPVETLLARHEARAPNDVAGLVATLVDGKIVYREITWVGCRHLGAAEAADMPPVRIRQGAFADNLPHRDLLVTPDHCIFVDGRLIPARMLVNHRSIVEDCSIGRYSFYHVELAEHAILLAEGLGTESYLDTGNRSTFGDGTVTALRPVLAAAASHKSWADDACAPLTVDQATVQPVWTALDRRASTLGYGVARPPLTFSDAPELRLLLCDGRELRACAGGSEPNLFRIPRGTRPVRLLSNAARPSEVIGPFVDDRRMLGVAVAKLVFRRGRHDSTIEASALSLPGWHALEGGARWTDGQATLELPEACDSDTFLEVHVAATMRYPVVEPAIAAGVFESGGSNRLAA